MRFKSMAFGSVLQTPVLQTPVLQSPVLPTRFRRRRLGLAAWVSLCALSSVVSLSSSEALADTSSDAAAPDASVSKSIVVKGSKKDTLVVGVAGAKLIAHICPDVPGKNAPVCAPTDPTSIMPPTSVKARLDKAELRKVRTSLGRELVEISVPASDGRKWMALIAATDASPTAIWSGFVTLPISGKALDAGTEYAAQKDGTGEKITITKHLALCGRGVVASRQIVDPKSLVLSAVAIDDPAPDARKSAVKVTAKKLESAPKSPSLLRNVKASSGDGAAIADGDLATAWRENAPGVGTQQFVVASVPESVAVSGFDLSFVPPKDLEGARVPKSLLVVTRDRSFAVELAEDPLAAGGASFSVELSEPLHTRCLGLVLGEAFPERASSDKAPAGQAKAASKSESSSKPDKPEPTSFVSELSLRTRFEGSTLDDVSLGLHGGGVDARARAELLSAASDEGVQAAIRAYGKLDGPGQDLARRVIDASTCEQKLALYVPMLASKDEDDLTRAHDRVRRCGKEAGPALLARLGIESGEGRSVFAEELALLSPDTAVPTLVGELSRATTSKDRLLFRRALVKSSERDSSRRAFDAALAPESFDSLPIDAKLDLLRAMGSKLGTAKRGSEALADVATKATDFRGRFLLLGPVAALARTGNQQAMVTLGHALAKDPDARIRTRAAEVAQAIPALDGALLSATVDPAVRVREAASHALEGQKLLPKEQARLAMALPQEPWTFVRRAAVQALSGMKGDAQVDASLALAMEHEDQPTVRQDILSALGTRGARSQRQAIKDRADDLGEAVDVRVEAVMALGKICDGESLSDLTRLALKGATPFYESDRKLSTAAIVAVGRLHPTDIAVRLAPLLSDKVPGDVQDSARAAIAQKKICR